VRIWLPYHVVAALVWLPVCLQAAPGNDPALATSIVGLGIAPSVNRSPGCKHHVGGIRGSRLLDKLSCPNRAAANAVRSSGKCQSGSAPD
jgi:hypothetical protein